MRLFVNRLIRFSKNYTNNRYKIGSNDWLSVAYGNGIYIAVGENNTVGKSTDGINWTTITITQPSETISLKDVTYGNNNFVICAYTNGSESSAFATRVYYSTDGSVWSATNKIVDGISAKHIAYGTGQFEHQFIMTGIGEIFKDVFVVSSGFTNWNSPQNIGDDMASLNSLEYLAYGTWLTVGKEIYRSLGGFTWSSVTPALHDISSYFFKTIAYNQNDGKIFVCGRKPTSTGTNCIVLTTTNFSNWEVSECPIIPESATFGDNKIVFCGHKTTSGNKEACIITTTDGKNFSNIIKSDNEEWNDVVYANNKFLVVGDNGYVDILTF